MIGRTLNDTYKLERRIGFGGMGRVYAGQHLRLSRPIAVKVLQSKFSSNPDAVERFRHEARSASALGHPNIVQVFDFNQSEDRHWYIVMELLEGEDLRAMLKREKRLTPLECLPILKQVCDALDLAHSKGLVHRDLKPSNIYLRTLQARTEVKILDFGVAKVLGADLGLTMDGTMLGTPHYMAPEQAAGEGNLTPRVDIYAIGTVLFEMLTGRRPFEGDSPLAVLHLRATRPPPPASSLVPALVPAIDEVLIRALAREPSDRFESPAQLALSFEKAIADAPTDRTTYTLADSESSFEMSAVSTPPSDGPDTYAAGANYGTDITGETILASMDGSTASPLSGSSSSIVQLKSSDELRMATILVVAVNPIDADESDPDEILEQTETLLEKLSELINNMGGTIEKDIGDTLTAVFGVPTATGDDPVHAVRAGLAARDIGRRHISVGVETRIGIQTGRILKRSGRTGVTGEVVKVAVRLADECPAGDVIVGHQTYIHIRGRFDVSFRDELRLRGQKQPLRTYRVTGERDHGVVLEHRGSGENEAQLVGREAERDYLRGLYRRASRESVAQVVLLLGGRGMGTTRLADELVSVLEEHSERFSYFPARASELAAPSPYALLAEVLRVKTGSSRATSSREAAAQLIDLFSWPFGASTTHTMTIAERPALTPMEIARAVGSAIGVDIDDESSAAKADVSPERLALALATYLRALARQQPVLLVLDDLHRADEESLELMELMMRQLEDAPVMLLAIAPTDFREERPTFMSGFEHFVSIELRSLSEAAVTAQVNALLDGMAPQGLGAAIHKRSGGNPHLVEEMVVHLRDAGTLCREDASGPWVVLGNLEELDVPSRAESLLQARLDQLPKQDRELLRCAAVIGHNFWEGALSFVGLDRVESRLDALVQTDLVHLRPTSRFPGTRQWAFKSELMAEVARSNLPARDRRQLHQAIAEWFGQQDQRDPDTLSLHAHHLVQAGQRSAALDLMAEAGRIAEKQQRWPVALACFIQAHELASGEGDEASSLYHATHVGRLGVRAHSPSKSVPVLLSAVERAEKAGDEAMQCNLLQLLGRNLAIQGEKSRARETTEKALAIAERRGDLRLRFESAKALGFVHYYGDDFSDAAEAFVTCIEMAKELEDSAEVAMNIYNVADSSLSGGDWEKALEFADRAVAACRSSDKVSFLVHSARGISAYVRAYRHDDEAALDELEEWITYADENGYVDQQLDARYYLATALEKQGRPEEALGVARGGLTIARESEGEQSRRKMIELVAELERDVVSGD